MFSRTSLNVSSCSCQGLPSIDRKPGYSKHPSLAAFFPSSYLRAFSDRAPIPRELKRKHCEILWGNIVKSYADPNPNSTSPLILVQPFFQTCLHFPKVRSTAPPALKGPAMHFPKFQDPIDQRMHPQITQVSGKRRKSNTPLSMLMKSYWPRAVKHSKILWTVPVKG